MRKFAIILLRDIEKGRNSLVRREFSEFLSKDTETKIIAAFEVSENKPDDDINVSVDQTNNLTVAIAKGLSYPTLDSNGHVAHSVLFAFLEKLCGIFKWEKYYQRTLGKVGKDNKHGMLSWYAVILGQWISGSGLKT
jgi:hypothetical protein